ncbi:MarR family winged helix-turn-helix transcriptional regulator [Actinomyces lilanjuaniae]|nr:MarR family transcriptional regulator [Actinomyces lilanjuaniae]
MGSQGAAMAEPLLEDWLCLALYRASRAVIRSYGPLLSDAGLTYPQYLVMTALWQEDGPLGVSELGRRLGLDSGTLTPLLRRLEEQGRVERRRVDTDERRVMVHVTPAGQDLRRQVGHVAPSVARRYPLSTQEAATLHAQLCRVTRVFEASEG